jgi:hypothetical protein
MMSFLRDFGWVARRAVPVIGALALLALWVTYGQEVTTAATATPHDAAAALFVLVQVSLVVRLFVRTFRIVHPDGAVRSVEYAHAGVAIRRQVLRRAARGNPLPDRMDAAHHEAAHAVATLVVGRRIRRVEVFNNHTDDATNGTSTQQTSDDERATAQLFWDALRISMAGHVWDIEHGVLNSGSWKDWNNSLFYATCLTSCGQPVTGLPVAELDPMMAIVAARTDASTILAANADWIERVAVALASSGELNEAEIRDLGPGAGDGPTSLTS